MDEDVDYMGIVICPIWVVAEEHRFDQPWEQGIEERSFLPFGWIEEHPSLGNTGDAVTDAVVVGGQPLSCPRHALVVPHVPVQALDGVMLNPPRVFVQVGRNLSDVSQG